MAKELPYFKFEPNQWENGNVQMCSRESKGLFIDLCSIYWSRLGELPYALALQKHCNGNKDALQELESCNIITIKKHQIIIEFLDEQLNDFKEVSEKRRKSANKRWSNASALQVDSKSNAIREEKKREDKIKEEKKETETASPFSFMKSLIKLGADKQLATDWLKVRKTKRLTNTETAFNGLVKEIDKSDKSINEILTQCCQNSWGGFKASWKVQESFVNTNKPKFDKN